MKFIKKIKKILLTICNAPLIELCLLCLLTITFEVYYIVQDLILPIILNTIIMIATIVTTFITYIKISHVDDNIVSVFITPVKISHHDKSQKKILEEYLRDIHSIICTSIVFMIMGIYYTLNLEPNFPWWELMAYLSLLLALSKMIILKKVLDK
ncbi:hypothetical protein [Methanococcus aeolicus]|uniref:Uncharacterized protein n=1 Tax=Methanococcus aeolicus (strain ATCC BAA-1280 / DSM 17508 / OCM 812 / Nankai-3) TaxID=419665 RepID=A6UUE7_META3|nr:hypothetical protein [Methanococcus aeolicus]ABR56119.1 hypothetical protein Maeo_0533 [Methanococcus aeolicus Nankai-3]UXM85272.1 hypothetical protein N6C89_03070 [Methanococcus aeolicus]